MDRWVLENYQNKDLEKKAMFKEVERCIKEYSPQKVVNDAISSFRQWKVDINFPTEIKAKEVLINLTKTKFLEESDKRALVQFLVLRNEPGYETDYSYIFDKMSA